MKSLTTEGMICQDICGIQHDVCRVSYTEFENGEYEYSFAPVYEVIDLLSSDAFQGIPGLDLSLRKQRYDRRNVTPVFIEERTPAPNREDLWALLGKEGMASHNRLEWLIRSGMHYSGDGFYVRSLGKEDEAETVLLPDYPNKDSACSTLIKQVLEPICKGKTVVAGKAVVDSTNRFAVYHILMPLQEAEKRRVQQARANGMRNAHQRAETRGKKRIKTDPLRVNELHQAVKDKRLTAKDAARKLGISVPTFYRRVRELKESENGS